MNQPTWREDVEKYKCRSDDCNEYHFPSNPDFIEVYLSQQRKEIVEDVEKTVQKELETWARESIGAKAVESVQKALADIITKLSKPEV